MTSKPIAKAKTNTGDFEFIRSESIPLLSIEVEEYRHCETGAIHYHLAADKTENVFLVAVRTMPEDSAGVAHILEHTVLCGSQKYPVRDPFFMMIRRSINTFMNAFTSSDWTAYPFASQNKKDFNNLLDVYLDAVFFSNLHELDFSQEGHRIEFAKPDDPNSPLEFKGVVFNEMKGAMGSEVSQLWQILSKYLFPTTTYHFNSGGEPADIPDLSYQDLMNFYRKHYHPSNAIFMTYGDIPAAEHQKHFQDKVLSRFSQSEHVYAVPNEKRYLAPVNIEEYYGISEQENTKEKSHIVMAWLLGNSTDIQTQFAAHLLSGALMDNSASPLLLALETTDLGSSPSPLCGIEDSNKEISFMCGLEGCNADNAAAVEALILKTLNQVADDGIGIEKLEAVLHQFELEQREIGGGGYPYGLQIMLDALPCIVHRSDPIAMLDIDPVLNQLRESIKDPNYIKTLVKELLIQNNHRVRLTLKPDTTLEQKKKQAERARLDVIRAALSEQDVSNIIEKAGLLKQRQSQEDDLEILPKVTTQDIPDSMYIATSSISSMANCPSHVYKQATNGINYMQAVAKFPALSDNLLDVLPYYNYCLTELGYLDQDYLAAQDQQSSISGGINSFTAIRATADDIQDASGYFFLSGKALSKNTKPMLELMRDIYYHTRFDESDRIRELFTQLRSYREQSVMRNGHGLAMMAACAEMSAVAKMKNRLNGLEGIKTTKALGDRFNKNGDAVLELCETFKQIHRLFSEAEREYVLITEPTDQDAFQQDLQTVWNKDNNKSSDDFSLSSARGQSQQIWITNSTVNFCAKAYPVVGLEHADAPALSVLGSFLRNGFLHTAIRENGGAYGSGASYQSDIGAFRFHSYRDPRLVDTLTDFDNALDWLMSNSHEERQLEEAILNVVSSIDKPTSPAAEAKDAYQSQLFGRTPEIRQQFRHNILQVTLDDLQRIGNTYFHKDKASIAVVSNA
ncbi:MAG: insulinase family protein, partial [Thiohalomonadales bacterium]